MSVIRPEALVLHAHRTTPLKGKDHAMTLWHQEPNLHLPFEAANESSTCRLIAQTD